MQAPTTCPRCGIELGCYVETHCPQCRANLATRPPVTLGIRLLDLIVAVCGTLFVLGSLFGFVFYMNTSSRAQLYQGAPYHSTTFRVTSVLFYQHVSPSPHYTEASAIGIVEGQKESMDLIPYLGRIPRNERQLMNWVPEGTVVPVYLFPTLKGKNRIQPIHGVPTEDWYRGLAAWSSNRVFPVVGAIGILTALLILARLYVSRNGCAVN